MIILREQKLEAMEVVEKEKEYMEYIKEHIGNVQKAFYNLFSRNYDYIKTDTISNEEFKRAISSIRQDIVNHDASKLSDDEFYSYRIKYYPTIREQTIMNEDPIFADKINSDYDVAWMHHFMNNNHHPKYWKVINGEFQENNKPTDMNLGAIIHMICDWQAMAYHYKNSMLEWYENQAETEKNDLSYNSRKITENILYTLPQ